MHLRTLFASAVCVVTLSAGTLASARQDQEESPIRRTLAEEVVTYHDILDKAEADLAAALVVQIEKISGKLAIEERVLRKEDLEQQVEAFKRSGTEPENRTLRRATEAFWKKVEKASDHCYKAHTQAAEAFGKENDLDEAAAILKERNELHLVQGSWLPPVPKYVSVNVKALRAHRPRYVNNIETELDAVVDAGKKRDRLRFRRAIDRAIVATRASKKKGEPAGNPNSRADIILVLNMMRAGEWDTRSLRIHVRDHRKKEWVDGLPGVAYK